MMVHGRMIKRMVMVNIKIGKAMFILEFLKKIRETVMEYL